MERATDADFNELDLSAHALRPNDMLSGTRVAQGRGAGGKQTRRNATKLGSHPRHGLKTPSKRARPALQLGLAPLPNSHAKIISPVHHSCRVVRARIAHQS